LTTDFWHPKIEKFFVKYDPEVKIYSCHCREHFMRRKQLAEYAIKAKEVVGIQNSHWIK
jgi:hypothetical protein